MDPTRCQFIAKKCQNGHPWIALQPGSLDMTTPGEIAGFELYAGTSIEEARQLARFLNNNIKGLRIARDGHSPGQP